MIGSRRMGMGADDDAGTAVAEIPHRLFLAGGLAMNIDNDGVRRLLERACRKLAVDGGEGIVEGIHEDAAHCVDNEYARAISRFDERDATPRRPAGEVYRTQQPRGA